MGAKRDIALVVDDSPETLMVLTDALEEAGIMVVVAQNGERGMELASRVMPDIILMDAIMPGMDGFETCRRLKQRGDLAHIPVVFMTGLSETEHIVRGLGAGGVDYVTKPIVPDELIARISVHIANARLGQSARAALDASGRSLMAVTRDAGILWTTPQAASRCAAASLANTDGTLKLPPELSAWIVRLIAAQADGRRRDAFGAEYELNGLRFVFRGRSGNDEFLFRIAEASGPNEQESLQEGLALTPREAEVLLWISQGKSNKDIGDILGLSPRTVNKHLEQIFAKLGVENRTAAAALAVRTIVQASTA
jgi:DNA-binding NarL/FixJ family response regulator